MRRMIDVNQGEWITPTLLNGWTNVIGRPLKFRKDILGRVWFKGQVNGSAKTNNLAFILPEVYRPLEDEIYLTKDDIVASGGVYLASTSLMTVETLSFSTI